MPFNFQDIFKSGLLEEVNAVPPADMALALGLAFAVGLFIFYIYKRCYAGVLYSASFGVTLIALTMITSLLILAVTSNVVLSLGMVGALSIVRFRTAIKDPSDIAFLFWAIAAGIVLAAGFIPLAVAGSLFIGAVLAGFSGFRSHAQPYILVLHCADAAAETAARQFVQQHAARLSLKSKAVEPGRIELNWEIRLKSEDTGFINDLAALPGVEHTVLVAYNGDYMN